MWDKVQGRIEKAITRIRTGIFANITSVIKPDTVYVQMAEDSEIRDVQVISPYGFVSIPNTNLFGQVIFNNSSKKAFLVGVENQGLPLELNIGEVMIFNQNGGNYILLKNDGKVIISGSEIHLNEE